MRRLGLDLTKDGRVTSADVKALTQAQAVEIFINHYFHAPRIDALPQPLQATVFDMHVNAGSNAIKLLQRLLNDMGQDVHVDGAIGPHSIRATFIVYQEAPDYMADAYGIARREYYYDLANRRPASRKYARRRDGGKGGWIKRAEEFMAPHYHLSSAEHQKRVAAWG
jgi:lysozyme family protein